MSRTITFPVLRSAAIPTRVNTETGLAIVKDNDRSTKRTTRYAVTGPTRKGTDVIAVGLTYDEAKYVATGVVEGLRELIAEAYDAAVEAEVVRETLAAARAGAPVGARPGLLVRFRTTFSAVLNGTEYAIEGYPRLDAVANKYCVTLRIVGTKMTRNGYLTDLRTLSTGSFVSYS